MGEFVNFATVLHKRTERDYIGRMVDDKVGCMLKAREYGYEYWDGDRRYGYGGYRYDGRWKPVAEALIAHYQLGPHAKVLDVGCGKAHLLYELQQLVPGGEMRGIDISQHGIAEAPEPIGPQLDLHAAQDPYPWPDGYFDLVISLATLHNLRLPEVHDALGEIERVGGRGYVMVESYRDPQELFNLQCWALTAESFLDADEWIWLFDHFGYTGDYEFIYFE